MFEYLRSLPATGLGVIALIVVVFVCAVTVLFVINARYGALQKRISSRDAGKGDSDFVSLVRDEYAKVYLTNGQNTNTPAIIDSVSAVALKNCLLGERFLSNATSIMVTLGLFGTFLGLMLSVSSLSQLLSLSSGDDWLGVLDSVGGGLLSSLSGMGVAFSTSLVGVAGSILLTLLRTIVNPQAQREKLECMTELWLDHSVAPTLQTEVPSDDAELIMQLSNELRRHADAVEQSLNSAATQMSRVIMSTTGALDNVLQEAQEPLEYFGRVVGSFNENVRDFTEFNQNLRNNIERMDVNFIRLTEAMRDAQRSYDGGERR